MAPPVRDGIEPQARNKKYPDHNKAFLSHSLFLSSEVTLLYGAYHHGIRIPIFSPKSRANMEYLAIERKFSAVFSADDGGDRAWIFLEQFRGNG